MNARAVFALAVALLAACSPSRTLARLELDDSTTGDAGSDAPFSCPSATMAAIDARYCIDTTEVTKAQYAAWLATSPSVVAQIEACDWNLDFAPSNASDDGTCSSAVNDANAHGDEAVVCVDWCDAYAFCAAAKKRLCGAIDGGPEGYVDDPDASLRDPSKSQWLRACTNGGTTAYPYGATFDPTACRYDPSDAGGPVPVGSTAGCHGRGGTPFGAIYDLSGDVAEWTDDCVAQVPGESGRNSSCFVRGGWWGDFRSGALACDPIAASPTAPPTVIQPRAHVDHHIGFRCCAP